MRAKTVDSYESSLHLSLDDDKEFQVNPQINQQLVQQINSNARGSVRQVIPQEVNRQEGLQKEKKEQEEVQEGVQEGVQQNQPADKYQIRRRKRDITRSKGARIRNVRRILSRTLGVGSFRISDEKFEGNDLDEREPPVLHNSRGKKLFEEGNNVLEFDMAGSGYQGFPQQQKDVEGHYSAKGMHNCYPALIEGTWKRIYGDVVEVKDKKRQFIRRRVQKSQNNTTEKHRITMAGPSGFWAVNGMLNAGEYKIESLREYMLELGKDYILNKLDGAMALEKTCKQMKETGSSEEDVNEYCELWKKIRNYKPITIVLKGHSRGGVALSHGAMMIQYWINENLPMLKDLISFETVQYDPVPGPHWDEDKTRVSLVGGSEKEKRRLAKKKMAPLNETANTTVVYSMDTQYGGVDKGTSFMGGSFVPQIVKGVKRLILSPYNHSVSLRDVDSSQEKKHRAGYTYAKKDATGKVKEEFYRSSGLNELEEGVFVADEDGVLTRMDTCDDAMRFLDLAYEESGDKRQWRRHKAIREAVKAWFDNHEEIA